MLTGFHKLLFYTDSTAASSSSFALHKVVQHSASLQQYRLCENPLCVTPSPYCSGRWSNTGHILFLHKSLLCARYFHTSLGVLLCIFASPRRHTAVVGGQTPAIYCFCIKAFFVFVIFTPPVERFCAAASSSSFALHKAVHCHSEAFMPKNLS